MESAPLFNHEDSSEPDGSEQVNEQDKKFKKRKKSTPEWLQRLLRTEEPKPSEENTETNRFLEVIKNPFGRLFGIEKEELDEEEKTDDSDIEDRPLFTAPEAAKGTIAAHEDDDETEVLLPQGLLINQDTVEEMAAWDPGSDLEASNHKPEQTTPEEALVRPTSPPDAESEVDRLRAEVESHAMTATEINPDSRLEEAGQATNRPEASSAKEREIIVEKRGGAGAAAVGFVAAELLSRSRDKKIRREAKQLKKKVERFENKVSTDTYEAKKVEARNQEQLRELVERRRVSEKIKKAPEIPAPASIDMQPLGRERMYSPQAESTADSKGVSLNESELRRPNIEAEPVAIQYDRIHDQKQEILAKIQEAGEQSYAGEKYYERRHEVKDEPASREGATDAVNVSNGKDTREDSDYSVGSYVSTASDAPIKRAQPSVPDEYKQAMVQGATTGIILLVGFIIVLILWSLL